MDFQSNIFLWKSINIQIHFHQQFFQTDTEETTEHTKTYHKSIPGNILIIQLIIPILKIPINPTQKLFLRGYFNFIIIYFS